MTLDQFLDEYVPNVLKPMGGWEISGKRGEVRRWSGENCCCPLTAPDEAHATWGAGYDGAKKLGLSRDVARMVINAADLSGGMGWVSSRPIRARLLAGLGLAEGK